MPRAVPRSKFERAADVLEEQLERISDESCPLCDPASQEEVSPFSFDISERAGVESYNVLQQCLKKV